MKKGSFQRPTVVRPNGQRDLVRVGSAQGGGCIFSAGSIAQTEHVISYGPGLNWDFEPKNQNLPEPTGLTEASRIALAALRNLLFPSAAIATGKLHPSRK